eukprot:11220900-Lingulodinium_polyedra.AAC.1
MPRCGAQHSAASRAPQPYPTVAKLVGTTLDPEVEEDEGPDLEEVVAEPGRPASRQHTRRRSGSQVPSAAPGRRTGQSLNAGPRVPRSLKAAEPADAEPASAPKTGEPAGSSMAGSA